MGIKVQTDRKIVTNSATQDKEVKINRSEPFDPNANSNMPNTVVKDKDEVDKDQEKLKDKVVDNNKTEMEKREDSDKTIDDSTMSHDHPEDPILEPTYESTSGKTTEELLNAEPLPDQNDSMYEDVKDSSYGEYVGGEDSIYGEENVSQIEKWNTGGITSINGSNVYNNPSYNNSKTVYEPPLVYDGSAKITPNLTIKQSMTTSHPEWQDPPTEEHLRNLKIASEHTFELIYSHFGGNVRINSAYRSLKLNSNLNPKGSLTSHHMKGYAFDLRGVNGVTNAQIYWWVFDNLQFTQLIWEGPIPYGSDTEPRWIHIAYVPGNLKNDAFRCNDGKTYLDHGTKGNPPKTMRRPTPHPTYG